MRFTSNSKINHRINNNIGRKSGVKKVVEKVVEQESEEEKEDVEYMDQVQEMEYENLTNIITSVGNKRKKDLERFIRENKSVINSLQPENKARFLSIVKKKFFS